jgi:hypothetical protein
MGLPANDEEYLGQRGLDHLVIADANMVCVVLKAYRLPSGFRQTHSDLLLRLSPGYPDVPPDMWWFDPPVSRADGRAIQATQVIESHLGRQWQRWSRHFPPGFWRSGIDSIESFLALIRSELERSTTEPGR